MKARNVKDVSLGEMSVPWLVVKLTIPSIIAQIINLLYNIIDRIFIGNLPEIGTEALTGVGVASPIITLISAFAAFAGQGSAALAAIALGQGKRDKAEKILGNAVTLILLLAAVLTVVFSVWCRPVLYAFGASKNTIGYAVSYLRIYLFGTLFVQLTLGLNMFISSQGRPVFAMISVLVGAIVHLALNPLFMFTLDMGVEGAALSTVISQGTSAICTLVFLAGKKSAMCIRIRNLFPDDNTMKNIAVMGISPFIMQSSDSIVSVVMNIGLLKYGGDLYVGAYTILQSVMQMLVLPVSGLTQGAQAIISYNYGASKNYRVCEAYRWMLGLSLAATCSGTVLFATIPGIVGKIFTSDQQILLVIKTVMPLYFCGVWAFGLQAASQTAFMGIGKARISLFLALLRKIFLMVPLAYLLPRITSQADFIFVAEPISDVTAGIITFILFMQTYKRLKVASIVRKKA